MEKTRRKRRGATAWRGVLTRYEESGLTAAAFCEREGICSQSLYHWRTRLGRVPDQPVTEKVAGVANTGDGFIDLGAMRAGSSHLELRLDLGGGVLLHLVRD